MVVRRYSSHVMMKVPQLPQLPQDQLLIQLFQVPVELLILLFPVPPQLVIHLDLKLEVYWMKRDRDVVSALEM